MEPPENQSNPPTTAPGPITTDVVIISNNPDAEIGGTSLSHNAGPNNGPIRVTILTLEILRELVQDKRFNFRISVTEEEISDRSKGDALSKDYLGGPNHLVFSSSVWCASL